MYPAPNRWGYEYPPSQFIQSQGPIDAASHFFADGQAYFNGSKVDCQFEVAYTYDFKAVVVCYCNGLTRIPAKTSPIIIGKSPNRDSRFNNLYEVEAKECTFINVLERDFGERNITAMLFYAKEYSVIEGGEKARSHLRKNMNDAENITYAITGITFPTYGSGLYPKYHHYNQSDEEVHLGINGEEEEIYNAFQELGITVFGKTVPFSNLYSATLDNCYIQGDKEQDTSVEIWCALMSIALVEIFSA